MIESRLSATAPPSSPLQIRRGQKHHDKGVEYSRADRWTKALHEFEEAVRCAPDQPRFHYGHGIALSRFDRFEEAIAAFQRELAMKPDHPPTLAEIGACHARLGRRKEGIPYLRKALNLFGGMPNHQFNLGLALLSEGKPLEAIAAFDRALALDPTYINAYRLRGLAHAINGNQQQSVQDLHAAVALDTRNYQTMLVLGTQLGKSEREREAGMLFEMAAKVAPDIALPQYFFAHFLISHHLYEMGLKHVDRAIALEPRSGEYQALRAFGLLGQGRIDESVASYRRAGELDPSSADIAGGLLFTLQHKTGVTKQDLLDAHKRWAALYRPREPKDRFAFGNDPDSGRRPRLGLVSADMHRHAVTYLVLRAFEQLGALGYEIFCYKTDRKRQDDEFSDRYKAVAASWRDVSDLDDDQLAALIAEQGVDVLFDLSGHTHGCRLTLFAQRAAPVQLSWAGYVGTIGLDTYDGLIADPVEAPPCDDEYYVEPIIRLPDCYVCYQPPLRAPDVGPLPFLESGVFTFGCFNRPAKLNAEVARAWARILERVPNGRILLVYGGLQEPTTQEAVYMILENGGLSRERVDLIGESDQQKLLQAYVERIDLALDPFPYSGGVTTLEAMWMGVPVVTMVGETFAGRHSATHLTAAGLSHFCTYSVEDYVELAVGWAERPQELASLRLRLREQVASSPLNDPVRFGNNLSTALMGLWKDWCDQRAVIHGEG
ncbi:MULTISPECIES: tetratricopeptide repeat protein [Methylosinus]|uniref:protein O-GlcNAc transferase n=1 Tax=Methylosinus trichosporium (strain ATCC 35070 / NCIMB 11131 / UNIQEM 75 / OB3b) TaxID=595536 RepID=A0A2D2D7N0_METT3|nr:MULTISPECIES: glycosyltransferase family 41 protein [Methylosinus]ATQ71018.1 glycosyltransferase [Methylosinus trichosporium OB3b]OBS54540.1 hypothetical protein A8B73_00010 [Methylosinus sp. 3S-1]